MKKIVIAGGSGFIGTAITQFANKMDYEVVVLSRSGKAPQGARGVTWDAEHIDGWVRELDGADGVINLTGASIAKPWTKENRAEIIGSRVHSTNAIGSAIRACTTPPKVWVNSSAIGYFGDRGNEELTDTSAPGKKGDFLVDVCVAWEQTFKAIELSDTRKTIMRTGIVLGKSEGTLPMLAKFTRMFLGGHHGSGSQYMSWIHVDDIARLYVHCIEQDMPLQVNGTAPMPCSNRFFMASLRAILGRPWSPPVPAFALKLAQLFGAPDSSLVLESQRVLPKAAKERGFKFVHEELRESLVHLLGQP